MASESLKTVHLLMRQLVAAQNAYKAPLGDIDLLFADLIIYSPIFVTLTLY